MKLTPTQELKAKVVAAGHEFLYPYKGKKGLTFKLSLSKSQKAVPSWEASMSELVDELRQYYPSIIGKMKSVTDNQGQQGWTPCVFVPYSELT